MNLLDVFEMLTQWLKKRTGIKPANTLLAAPKFMYPIISIIGNSKVILREMHCDTLPYPTPPKKILINHQNRIPGCASKKTSRIYKAVAQMRIIPNNRKEGV